MSISDGQRVRALESNTAWASKSADNTFTGKQTLNRSGSGAQIVDTQQKINDIDADLIQAESDIVILQGDVATLQSLDTFIYVGQWNATTNNPALADGDGGSTFGIGATYRVSVAGTQDLGSGNISFSIGDKVIYNTLGKWEKWDVTDEVTSVNGFGGDVTLNLNDINDVVAAAPSQRDLLQKGATNWESFNPNEILTNAALTGANQVVPASNGFFKVIRLTNASLASIEGIAFSFDQEKVILVNDTGVSFDVIDNAATTPAEGIITGTGADLTLEQDQTLLLIYDSVTARWRIIGGTGSGGGGVGYQEVPAGAINGANTIFGPLTFLPNDSNSLIVMLDGIALEQTAEWSYSGGNVTLVTPPEVGQKVYVFYLTEGTPAPPPVFSNVLETEYRTISAGEESSKQLTLAQAPITPSKVMLDVVGGGVQFYSDDFIVTGSILDWNGLGLDGLLLENDRVRIVYVY